MIYAGPPLYAIAKSNWSPYSAKMNENALLRMRILSDDSRFPRELESSSRSQHLNLNK
jgi:hypothetical protein